MSHVICGCGRFMWGPRPRPCPCDLCRRTGALKEARSMKNRAWSVAEDVALAGRAADARKIESRSLSACVHLTRAVHAYCAKRHGRSLFAVAQRLSILEKVVAAHCPGFKAKARLKHKVKVKIATQARSS